jgi:hypothetical protein
MRTRLVRAGALAAAAGLALLPTAAQSAGPVVAQSGANALTLSVGGNPFSTGAVTAVRDQDGEDKTGDTQPPIDVLNNQGLLNVGALVQDADTDVTNRNGSSEACAGVVGNGGAVATVGDSSCVTPGEPVGISLANLDLTGAVLINPSSALGPLAAANPLLSDVLAPVTAALSDGLESALGNLAIGGAFGTVESRCTADRSGAQGTANITDASIGASVGGQNFSLIEFPTNPAPNTKLLTDLDEVVNVILDGVETQLEEGLGGLAAPVAVIVDPLQDQIVTAVIGQIAPQLAPLEENVLDVTLNKQTVSNGGDKIVVTAIDLKVLPAAQAFGFDSLVGAEIASVTCGPSGRLVPEGPDPEPNPDPDPDPNPNPGPPEVPTVVDAGAFGPVDSDGGPGSPLLWGLTGVLAASAAGAVAGRRLLRR